MRTVSFRRMPESRGFHPARMSLDSGVRRNDEWDTRLDRMIP
jgi:hypothetical protein